MFSSSWRRQVARYAQFAERLRPYLCDTVAHLHQALREGRRVLIEGANATMLDLDFGTYPFVTSSNPSIGGIITGLGIAPSQLGAIVGVAKAYTTRVGSGPYPTEIFGQLADDLRAEGYEYGTTTGEAASGRTQQRGGDKAMRLTRLPRGPTRRPPSSDRLARHPRPQLCVHAERPDLY